jgi:hypothetical protein
LGLLVVLLNFIWEKQADGRASNQGRASNRARKYQRSPHHAL